jgi:hypothetical protein
LPISAAAMAALLGVFLCKYKKPAKNLGENNKEGHSGENNKKDHKDHSGKNNDSNHKGLGAPSPIDARAAHAYNTGEEPRDTVGEESKNVETSKKNKERNGHN